MEGYLPLPVIIGRGGGANLKISDEAISREHVLIALTDRGLVMRDLSSKNGTYLSAGDYIAAGPVTFRVSRRDSAVILQGGYMEDHITAFIRRH